MSAPAASPDDVARIGRASRIRGTLEVPGDKSISHRGAIMNAIAHGTRHRRQLPAGSGLPLDARLPAGARRRGHVRSDRRQRQAPRHRGRGTRRPARRGDPPARRRQLRHDDAADGQLLAGQPIFSVMTGDASLSSRPMARLSSRCGRWARRSAARRGRLAPLVIEGGNLRAIDYTGAVASAQVKSCVLLAAASRPRASPSRGRRRLPRPHRAAAGGPGRDAGDRRRDRRRRCTAAPA